LDWFGVAKSMLETGTEPDFVVVDETGRVWRFHRHTLDALKEGVPAAGLQHAKRITAAPTIACGCWPTR
jgi:hypothetical protein